MKISAVVIAKNEEEMIGEALDSLSFCNEIIIVDNGSTDKTKQISEKKGAIIYQTMSSDFSELRNLGLQKSSFDYILYLDADERISEQLKKEIINTVKENRKYSAFKLPRKNFYFEKNQWPYIEKMERLFKKGKLLEWKGKLHESPTVDGEVGELKSFIIHYTHRDFESMLKKTMEWSDTEALIRFNLGHPPVTWWRFPRVMITAFLNSYIKQQGFKAGAVGILESTYQSFSIFVTYAKLWELQHRSSVSRKNLGNS